MRESTTQSRQQASLPRKFCWAIYAFLQRPLAWVLGGGISLVWGFFLLEHLTGAGFQHCSPRLEISTSHIYTAGALEQSIADGKAESITELHFDSVHNGRHSGAATAASQAIKSIEQLPKLEALQIDRPTAIELELISRLKQLRRLSLHHIPDDESVTLDSLASMQRLEQVEIQMAYPLPSLSPLEDLLDLRVLSLPHCGEFTQRHFKEIARIDSLEVLILPQLNIGKITPEMLAQLNELPRLRKVYLEVLADDFVAIDGVQARMVNATVHRGMYRQARVQAFSVGMYVMFALAFSMMHFVGVFSLPQAKLTPGFAKPHLLACVIPPVVVLAGHSLLLWYLGSLWLPAIAFLLLIFGMTVWMQVGGETQPWIAKARFPVILICASFSLTPMVLLSWSSVFAEIIEAYLLGQSPALAIASLAVGGCLCVDALRRLPQCHDVRAASGLGAVLVMKDQQAAQLHQLNKPDSAVSKILSGQDKRLSAVLALGFHQDSWRRRVKLLRAAVQNRASMAICCLIFVAMLGFRWLMYPDSSPSDLASGRRAVEFIAWYAIAGGIVLVGWWRAMPTLLGGLSLPQSRRMFATDTFIGLAVDLLMPMPFLMFPTAIWLNHAWSDPLGIASAGIAIVGVFAIVHSFCVWTVSFRKLWLLILAGVLAEVVFGGVAALLVMSGDGVVMPSSQRVALIGIGLIAAACISTGLAWKRWLRLEPAML